MLKNLPQNFRKEEDALHSIEIDTWKLLSNLIEEEILDLVKNKFCSYKNLKRLRCIAFLKTELNISYNKAALLMHAGVSTINALTKLTPQELIQRTGRFERFLQTGRNPIFNLTIANDVIKKAKAKEDAKLPINPKFVT